jgi:hypothetical protein
MQLTDGTHQRETSSSASDLGSSSLSSPGSSAAPRCAPPLSHAYKVTSAATGNPRSSASLSLSNPQSLSILPSTLKTSPEFALATVRGHPNLQGIVWEERLFTFIV